MMQALPVFISAFACCISAWILASRRGPAGLPGCGDKFNCEALFTGRWSRWGPIPVSILGTLAYLLLSVVLGVREFERLGLALALAVAGAGAWFVFLQAVVLRKVCAYCNIVHLLGFIVLGLVLFHSSPKAAPASRGWWRAPWVVPVLIALLGLVALIGGQLLLAPKVYSVESVGERYEGRLSDIGAAGLSPSDSLSQQSPMKLGVELAVSSERLTRRISLLGGRVKLNVADWPIRGSSDAAHLIAVVFDYTCPVCRTTHASICDAIKGLHEPIGLQILPVPTHPACNSTIKNVLPRHGYACEYARLAIGVWQTRPDRFEEFDRFMFSNGSTPPIGVAIAKAAELAGVSIDPYRPSKEIDGVIQRAVEVYRAVDKIKIPILMLPRAAVLGEINSVGQLQKLLMGELGLPPQPRHIVRRSGVDEQL